MTLHRSSALALALSCAACGTSSPASPPDATVDAAAADAAVAPDDVIVVPADAPPVGDPLRFDVRVRGPFNAGYRVLMHTYTPRGGAASRTIPVHVWYPTRAVSGPHPLYRRAFPDPDSIVDAPLAPPAHARGYPLHVYSHGHMGFGPTSHSLMVFFASHGWVAVAPEHVGNTISDTPNPRPFDVYHLRSQDVTAAIDFIAALPPSDPLSARCDTRGVVLSGHSFGAHTVWSSAGATFDVDLARASCTPATRCTDADLGVLRAGLRDARVVAAIPMAGSINRSLFGPMGHGSVRVPMLAMSGSDDPVGAEGQFASTAPVDLTWIDVRGGCHQFFALGGCDNIPDGLQDTIVGAWAMAFARRHVLSDGDPTVRSILDGTLQVSDRVTLRRR